MSIDPSLAIAVNSYIPPSLPAHPILQEGNSDAAVIELQQLLNVKGASLIVNGCFDPVTKAAVIKFQRLQNLEPNGIVNEKTWIELRKPKPRSC